MLILLAACTRQVTIDGLPPEDVTRVAILELDDGGRVLASSPLRALADDRPIWIEPRDDRTAILVGYTDRALADPETGALPSTIDSDPVAVASACDPRLDEPRWVARLEDKTLSAIDVHDAPPLTVPWLEARCRVPMELDLDSRCAEPRCTVRTVHEGACVARVETVGCAFGTIELSYQNDDLRCLELPQSTWSCERNTAAPDDRAVFVCGPSGEPPACPVEIIPKDRVETPPFDLARVEFGLLEPLPHPDAVTDRFDLEPYFYRWGQAFDMLPLGDQVIVTGIAGGDRQPCSTTPLARRLVFIDTERAVVTGTATAPDCLEALAPEIEGTGFIAGFHDGLPKLGRFDRQGRLLQAVTVGTSSDAAERFVSDIVLLQSSYVAVLESREMFALKSDLVFVDRDLTITGGRANGDYISAVVDVSDDEIAFWERDAVGSDSGMRIARVPSGEITDRTGIAVFGAYRPTSSITDGERLIVFSIDDKDVLLYTLRPLLSQRVLGVIGERGYVVGSALWPLSPLIIGGGAGGDEVTGFRPEVFFLDPVQERFLSGPRSIGGFGPISRVRADDRGRAWMLLPWAGELVRISARP